MNIEYYIINPTGNITALVTSDVDKSMYKAVAKNIMSGDASVEQVGFVKAYGDSITLNMSGDEFCGNATMSAAVLYADITKRDKISLNVKVIPMNISVPVEVEKCGGYYECSAVFPYPEKIFDCSFSANGIKYSFPAVEFAGITHIVADNTLSDGCVKALIADLADGLKVKALGIMVFSKETGVMKPFVYVKDVDTLFLENSCASGSCAVAFLRETNESLDIIEQGGIIKAVKLLSGIRLNSKIEIVKRYIEEM